MLCALHFRFLLFFSLSLLNFYSDEGRKKGNKNSGEVDCSEHIFFLMCFLGENLLLDSLSWHGGKSCSVRRAETG